MGISAFAWSPDRTLLCAVVFLSNVEGFALIFDAGSGEAKVIDDQPAGRAISCSWSPEGSRLVMDLYGGPDPASLSFFDIEGALYIYDVEFGQWSELSDISGWSPAWSPVP